MSDGGVVPHRPRAEGDRRETKEKAARIAPDGLSTWIGRGSALRVVRAVAGDLAGFGVGIIILGEAQFLALEHRGGDIDALRLEIGFLGQRATFTLIETDTSGWSWILTVWTPIFLIGRSSTIWFLASLVPSASSASTRSRVETEP